MIIDLLQLWKVSLKTKKKSQCSIIINLSTRELFMAKVTLCIVIYMTIDKINLRFWGKFLK